MSHATWSFLESGQSQLASPIHRSKRSKWIAGFDQSKKNKNNNSTHLFLPSTKVVKNLLSWNLSRSSCVDIGAAAPTIPALRCLMPPAILLAEKRTRQSGCMPPGFAFSGVGRGKGDEWKGKGPFARSPINHDGVTFVVNCVSALSREANWSCGVSANQTAAWRFYSISILEKFRHLPYWNREVSLTLWNVDFRLERGNGDLRSEYWFFIEIVGFLVFDWNFAIVVFWNVEFWLEFRLKSIIARWDCNVEGKFGIDVRWTINGLK